MGESSEGDPVVWQRSEAISRLEWAEMRNDTPFRWRCAYCKLEEGVPNWDSDTCPRCEGDPLVALVVTHG